MKKIKLEDLSPDPFFCGGSHPHLVHEFISALREQRRPFPDAHESANWTCTGILAHESAMEGGVTKWLPDFTLESATQVGPLQMA